MLSTVSTRAVSVRLMHGRARHAAMRRYFGSLAAPIENAIYGAFIQHCQAYRGGFWELCDLSNGGFFMMPTGQARWRLVSPNNRVDEVLGAEAAGVVACLVAFRDLAWHPAFARLRGAHAQLLAYAVQHREAAAIFRIIAAQAH